MAGKGKQSTQVGEQQTFTAIKDGSIVKLFEGPKGKKGEQILCPQFWELKWANGCNYDCQWCFLNGTYRFLERGKAPNLKPISITLTHIKHALLKIETPTILNAGELSDGLLFEEQMIHQIMPLFSSDETNPHGHKLLILTKSDSIRAMNQISNNIIMAHSVNAQYISRTYELRAPHPWQRIEASRAFAMSGFETRLRIDPIVPVKNWHVGYRELVDRIMERNPHVKVITMGTLRGLQSTINLCKKLHKDTSWTRYLEETTNFGKRPSTEVRVEIYTFIKDRLKEHGYKGQLAICKEPLEIWKQVGLKPQTTTCNCLILGDTMKEKKIATKDKLEDAKEKLEKVKEKIVNDNPTH